MPPVKVDPSRFTDKPFTGRLTWPDREIDYVVLVDGMTAGRLMRQTLAGSIDKWFWSVTAPYLPPEFTPEAATKTRWKALRKHLRPSSAVAPVGDGAPTPSDVDGLVPSFVGGLSEAKPTFPTTMQRAQL